MPVVPVLTGTQRQWDCKLKALAWLTYRVPAEKRGGGGGVLKFNSLDEIYAGTIFS